MTNSEQPDISPQRRGAIGVICDTFGRLLVIERSQTVRAPGRYCFPGGGIEHGESEEQAVVRELDEELSIIVSPVRRLWTSETESGVLLLWWLVTLQTGQQPRPNPEEVARYFWMRPPQILRQRATLKSNREFLMALAAGRFSLDADNQ